MRVPGSVLHITKHEGATRQIEAAIDALQRGDFDVAVTLAGAAEGMLGAPDQPHLWPFLRDHPKVSHIDQKERIEMLNQDRDWLKHLTPQSAPTLTLEPLHAGFMIARAASKLEPWTPKMEEFKEWLLENINDLWGRA